MPDFLVGFTQYDVVTLSIEQRGKHNIYSGYSLYDRRVTKYDQMYDLALELLMGSLDISEILENDRIDKETLEDYEAGKISEEEVYKDFFASDLRSPESFFDGLWVDDGVLENHTWTHDLPKDITFEFMPKSDLQWLLDYVDGKENDEERFRDMQTLYELDYEFMDAIETYILGKGDD